MQANISFAKYIWFKSYNVCTRTEKNNKSGQCIHKIKFSVDNFEVRVRDFYSGAL